MSLDYFLLSRKQYSNVLRELEEILANYDELNNIQKDNFIKNNNFIEIFDNTNTKNIFILLKNHIQEFKQMCDKEIETLCDHEFVYDMIDTDLDTSKNICYCKICEFTK
jgi:DNA-binding transcriptional regulator GbsR (MarR family)